MAMVKVWNDNVHPFKQRFRDKHIEIGPKQCIEMEREEAHLFKYEFSPIERDANNQPMPTSFKMIRIEDHESLFTDAKKDEFGCIACKYKAVSKKDLMTHLIDKHADDLVTDDQAEAELQKKRGRPAKAS